MTTGFEFHGLVTTARHFFATDLTICNGLVTVVGRRNLDILAHISLVTLGLQKLADFGVNQVVQRFESGLVFDGQVGANGNPNLLIVF